MGQWAATRPDIFPGECPSSLLLCTNVSMYYKLTLTTPSKSGGEKISILIFLYLLFMQMISRRGWRSFKTAQELIHGVLPNVRQASPLPPSPVPHPFIPCPATGERHSEYFSRFYYCCLSVASTAMYSSSSVAIPQTLLLPSPAISYILFLSCCIVDAPCIV